MRPLIAGNWKMNGLGPDLVEIDALGAALAKAPSQADVLVCVPSTLVWRAAHIAAGRLAIGGEDCHHATAGAFTGDISAQMLKDAGAGSVIVGHSERRQHHGESDMVVQAKATAAFRAGLAAIICVGETLAQRQAGDAMSTCAGQLAGSVPEDAAGRSFAIGYEPLWAIGTGHVPTAAKIAQMHSHIRSCLVARFGQMANLVRILYGGSVEPANARAILALPEVGGALVGGASLQAEEFEAVVRAAGAEEDTAHMQ